MKNPEKFWDRAAKNYDKPPKKGIIKPSRSLVATKPYLNKECSVLDFGCATGKASIEISEFVKNVHGIDLSAKMIEIAKHKSVTQNIQNVTFRKATIYDKSLEYNSYDVIIAFNILHLLDDVELVFERIYKLLKPKGYLITNTPFLGEQKYFMRAILNFGSKLKVIPTVEMYENIHLETLLLKQKFLVIENKKLDSSSSNYFIVSRKS